jgi:trehalose 6-phosphate phosphatase
MNAGPTARPRGPAPQQAAPEVPADLAAAATSFAVHRPLLVALDFDGVLAPLVDDPASSRPLPGTMAAVRRLAAAEGVLVALVSGRARADLLSLAGVSDRDPISVVGSHGAEFGPDAGGLPGLDDRARARLAEVRAGLRRIADRHAGVRVEDKPTAAVLHTRRAASAEIAAAATAAAVTALAGQAEVYLTQGKDVVEAAVTRVSKGVAVQRLRDGVGPGCRVLYAGDDVTDETVFTSLAEGDVGVKVGGGQTAAEFRVADPAAVRALLRTLGDLVGGAATNSRGRRARRWRRRT